MEGSSPPSSAMCSSWLTRDAVDVAGVVDHVAGRRRRRLGAKRLTLGIHGLAWARHGGDGHCRPAGSHGSGGPASSPSLFATMGGNMAGRPRVAG